MSTEPTEYGIPVVFDVSAHSRSDAGDALVLMLGGHQLPGNKVALDGRGTARIESWWTVEAIDKQHDRNDYDAGIVIFDDDLDYLLRVLERVAPDDITDHQRHARLLHYLDPHNRVGWNDAEEEA